MQDFIHHGEELKKLNLYVTAKTNLACKATFEFK